MKIIFGTSGEDIAAHARMVLRHNAKHNRTPRGIPAGVAKYMHICDDCGEGYWDSDEYGYHHPRCGKTQKVGF